MKGIIYSLKYKNKIIYIGQTKRLLYVRWQEHKTHCFIRNQNKILYTYLRNITTFTDFDNDISIHIIREVDNDILNFMEIKAINYCINKGVFLYNEIIDSKR